MITAQRGKQGILTLKEDPGIPRYSPSTQEAVMNSNRMVLAIAGTFICTSVTLGLLLNPNWFYFTGFIGFMLFQSAFTRFCPMDFMVRKLGFKPGPMFN